MYIPKKMFVAVLIIGVIASAITYAFAQGGDENLIHSCVNKSNGTIKIVSSDEECGNNWYSLVWSSDSSADDGPVTVGGGVTGRWEGTYTIPAAPAPCVAGTFIFVSALVQDSEGNITGSFRTDRGVGHLHVATAVLGGMDQMQIELYLGSSSLEMVGTVQNVNTMTGTVTDINNPCPVGTWDAQRIPPVP